MIFDIRWLPVLALNFFFIFLFQIVNDMLTPMSVYLYLSSILLVFPAYHLEVKGGYFCAIVSALAYDSIHTIDIGTSLLPFIAAFSFVFLMRNRTHPNSKTHAIVLNILINIILIFFMSLLLGKGALLTFSYWSRIFMDIIFSSIALCIFSPLAQILQRNTLLLCGFTLHNDKKIM